MKEYGGFLEFEHMSFDEYHADALPLNTGRNCLVYLIRTLNITKIYIPFLLCSSIRNACEENNVEFEFYSINENFIPLLDKSIKSNEFIYIVNYYGQLTQKKVVELKSKYKNIILDNVHAFFERPIENISTIYSCRKFLGVPDGAYLYMPQNNYSLNLEDDCSYDRMLHIFGRYEINAQAFYQDYRRNEELLNTLPLKRMSRLTHNMLRGIDYKKIMEIRTLNFEYLYEKLHTANLLKMNKCIGPYMYPLYIKNGERLRQKLIENKIYIPVFWTEAMQYCNIATVEYKYAKEIIPLPVDQRYTLEDMEKIYSLVSELINNMQ